MKKNVLKILISTLALLVLLNIDSQTTLAADSKGKTSEQPNVTNLTEEDVREAFTRYGVSKENQDALLEKYYNGEAWDSFKKGVEPISTRELQTDEGLLEVRTFPDGSVIAISKLPEITDEDEPLIIYNKGFDPGTITSGSGFVSYKNARIFYDTVASKAHFYADFTILQKGNDFISDVRDWEIFRLAFQISGVSLDRIQETETLDYPAEAQLFWISSFNMGGISQTNYLRLVVGNNRYDVYADVN